MKNRKLRWIAPLAFSVALLPTLVFGGQAVLPHVFTNGDVADADDVNANFNALVSAVNDNDGRIQALESGASGQLVRARVVPGDPVASGQNLHDVVNALGTVPADRPVRIQLDPGLYALSTSTAFVLGENVTLCGAGLTATQVETGVAVGITVHRNGGLRDLKVVTGRRGVAVFVDGLEADVRNLRIEFRLDSSSDSGDVATGLLIKDCETTLSGISILVQNVAATPSPTALFEALRATGESVVTLKCCDFTVLGGLAYGIRLNGFHMRVEQSTVYTTGTALWSDANTSKTRMLVHDSRITGLEFATQTPNDVGIHFGCCMVSGLRFGAGLKFVHCYDENYDPLP